MATLYADFDLTTGANDGSDWTDAYQSWATLAANWGASDTIYIKECTSESVSAEVVPPNGITVYGGCDSDLTGTATTPRTGITVLTASSTDYRCLNVNTGTGGQSFYQLEFESFSAGSGIRGGVAAVYVGSINVDFIDCVFTSNTAGGNGGALFCNQAGNLVTCTRCTFYDNTSGGYGGACETDYGVIQLEDCILDSNSATTGGGGTYGYRNKVYSIRSYFIGNTTAGSYGGVGNIFELDNCVLSANNATTNYGAGAAGYDTSWISNCTIVDNTTGGTVGGIGRIGGALTCDNSILWDNDGYQASGLAASSINYSDVQDKDSTGVTPSNCIGTGCVDVDPQFVGGTGDDQWDLTPATPVSVSRGASISVTNYETYDIYNKTRDSYSPSMGAVESPYYGGSLFDMMGNM